MQAASYQLPPHTTGPLPSRIPYDREHPTTPSSENSRSNFPMLPTPQPQGQPTSLAPPTTSPSQPPHPPSSLVTTMPVSVSLVENGRRYQLDVVQQPQRARMCGFGDKDRRPITPPPCVRLIITDAETGKEIDMNDINYNMYVLNVDLWDADGLKEVNLVRNATNSPQISTGTTTSYSQLPENVPALAGPITSRQGSRDFGYGNTFGAYSSQSTPGYSNGPTQHYGSSHNSYPSSPNSTGPSYSQQYGEGSSYYANGQHGPGTGPRPSIDYSGGIPRQPGVVPSYNDAFGPNDMPVTRVAHPNGPGGMYTRNLIGSLAASAFRLTDPSDKIGIWFVLQDLSVRTEGSFRLRFSFVNVGTPSKTANGDPANENSILNTGKAPVLAACYSEVFTVYSAKKFPGVVESTPLSRCFATQGIKIPIRKDGPSRSREEYDQD